MATRDLSGTTATAVAEGVHRLTNGVSNFYLIEENGKLVLVDAGAPKDWARLTGAITALGRALADLDAVILTHAHPDHTGFAEQARRTAIPGSARYGRRHPSAMRRVIRLDSHRLGRARLAYRTADNAHYVK